MTPQQIMDGMAEKNQMLTQKNDEYLHLTERRAQAERIYSVAVSKETLNLKSEGFPVTLIDKVVKGKVADFKYDLDVAEGIMKACKQAIENITNQIDSYRSLLSWQKEELARTR